jgi:hypothetical protein
LATLILKNLNSKWEPIAVTKNMHSLIINH